MQPLIFFSLTDKPRETKRIMKEEKLSRRKQGFHKLIHKMNMYKKPTEDDEIKSSEKAAKDKKCKPKHAYFKHFKKPDAVMLEAMRDREQEFERGII